MPVVAWIDERHLGPLGLTNAWGYNPVTFMALDPRLAPGGIAELRDTVAALREAGIGVILDLVFNHTGESDRFGPTLSLRGLDNRCFYRHAPQQSRCAGQRHRHRQHHRLRPSAGDRADPRCASPFRASCRRRRFPLRPCDGARPRRPGLRCRGAVAAGDHRRSRAVPIAC